MLYYLRVSRIKCLETYVFIFYHNLIFNLKICITYLETGAGGSPEKFVEVLRCALESDICTEMLPSWIDLIFGRLDS